MGEVSIEEMDKAYERLKGKLHKTPIMSSESINRIAGTKVHFKCDHLQKTGSFKSRGALNAIIRMKESKGDKCKGVVTFSKGNHGQSLAWAALQSNTPCCVVAPENTHKQKMEGMLEYKADVVLCGNNFSNWVDTCNEMQKKLDYDFISPFDNADMINGHASCGAEILEQVPEVDAVFVAVGGGGFASSLSFFFGEKRPDVKVYVVEPEAKKLRDYLYEDKLPDYDTIDTIADTIQALRVGDMCKPILTKYAKDNIVSVTEQEIRDALALIWTRTKQRVEPTAAVPLAGLLKLAEKPKNPVIILCGGNVDLSFVP